MTGHCIHGKHDHQQGFARLTAGPFSVRMDPHEAAVYGEGDHRPAT